jgi:hypothetical protein
MLSAESLKIKGKTVMYGKVNGRSDDFQTEDYAIDVLVPFLENLLPEDGGRGVWECACGDGQMARRLEKRGFYVHATDVQDGTDFLTLPRLEWPAFDVIVTNPPFSKKDAFLQRCFESATPFALLLPVTALGEQGRVGLYAAHGGIDIILPRRRMVFTTPSGKKGGAWFFCAWFTRGLVNRPAGCKNGQIVIA